MPAVDHSQIHGFGKDQQGPPAARAIGNPGAVQSTPAQNGSSRRGLEIGDRAATALFCRCRRTFGVGSLPTQETQAQVLSVPAFGHGQ